MFTGIIEEIGTIEAVKKGTHSASMRIGASKILSDMKIGDSIAVNGICLTVTSFDKSGFWVDVMHETLRRSSIGTAAVKTKVNLERAMLAGGRFGGHIVSGHIDGPGTIQSVQRDDNAIWYTIKTDENLMRYIVEKGSIAIDGISLTVATVAKETFQVSVIPHTREKTILSAKKPGDIVNLENDVIGKYVEKLIGGGDEAVGAYNSGITKDFLLSNGF